MKTIQLIYVTNPSMWPKELPTLQPALRNQTWRMLEQVLHLWNNLHSLQVGKYQELLHRRNYRHLQTDKPTHQRINWWTNRQCVKAAFPTVPCLPALGEKWCPPGGDQATSHSDISPGGRGDTYNAGTGQQTGGYIPQGGREQAEVSATQFPQWISSAAGWDQEQCNLYLIPDDNFHWQKISLSLYIYLASSVYDIPWLRLSYSETLVKNKK